VDPPVLPPFGWHQREHHKCKVRKKKRKAQESRLKSEKIVPSAKKAHHSDDGGEHKVSQLRTVVVMNPKSGQILSSAL
jgi:hypothetical protein